eukprot:UN23673
MLCGIFQMLFGLFKLGNIFTKFISESIMIGFCNGLAIVIGYAQLELFKDGHGGPWVTGDVAWIMSLEVVMTMAIVALLPKLTTKLPNALMGIMITTAFEHGLFRPAFGIDTVLVEDMASLKGKFPIPVWADYDNMPGFTWNTFTTCAPLAITLCLIGLVESLMTLKLIDEITNTKGDARKECVAQGFANVITGMFGGMGGCAMIGQSMINLNAGARGRLSSSIAGFTLLIIILAAHPIINLIPVASLAGVMFIVVYKTFEWKSLEYLIQSLPLTWRTKLTNRSVKVRRADVMIMFAVTIITPFTDLARAVIVGIICQCTLYIWEQKTITLVPMDVDENLRIYRVHSELFFGSCESLSELLQPNNDPQNTEVHFKGKVSDYSALHTIASIQHRYKNVGKNIKFLVDDIQSVKLMRKATDMLDRVELQYVIDEESSAMTKKFVRI